MAGEKCGLAAYLLRVRGTTSVQARTRTARIRLSWTAAPFMTKLVNPAAHARIQLRQSPVISRAINGRGFVGVCRQVLIVGIQAVYARSLAKVGLRVQERASEESRAKPPSRKGTGNAYGVLIRAHP